MRLDFRARSPSQAAGLGVLFCPNADVGPPPGYPVFGLLRTRSQHDQGRSGLQTFGGCNRAAKCDKLFVAVDSSKVRLTVAKRPDERLTKISLAQTVVDVIY
jgi:hypothetical protein